MSINEGPVKCAQCNRPLLNLEHRKCMYCGEPVPEGLQLSEEEASAILAAKHDKWKEDSKKRLWGRPTPPERDGTTFEEEWGWGEYFESGGGDSGGDEGGGD